MISTTLHDGCTLGVMRVHVHSTVPACVPATVPCRVHTDRLSQDLIPDLCLDLNESAVQWIRHSDVEYDLAFDFDRGVNRLGSS
jgi:beta-mannosidase